VVQSIRISRGSFTAIGYFGSVSLDIDSTGNARRVGEPSF